MVTVLVRRVLPVTGLVALVVAFARMQAVPAPNADMWFHLRFGEEFLSRWSVGEPGHLGVYDTAEWVPTQWLAQIGMARIEQLWGAAGVAWSAGAVAVVIVALLYSTCRAHTAPLPAVIATTMGTVAAAPGLSARPQVLSYLFIAITVAAWLATLRDGRPRYWLIAIAWIWPMLHGMWPVGVSVSFAVVVGVALERERPAGEIARLAAIPVLSAIVAALTPVGTEIYESLLTAGGRAEYFSEWGPTDFHTLPAATLGVMVLAVVAAWMRSASVRWPMVMLLVVGVVWAVYSMRTTPVAALVVTPLLASALQPLVPDRPVFGAYERAAVVGSVVAGCLLMSISIPGTEERGALPGWVDERLDRAPQSTRVLNDWNAGSYLLFRHPELDLVMHGYGDVFTDEELDRNVGIVRLQPGWDRRVEELDVDLALLRTDAPLAYALEGDLGWERVQADDDIVILEPPRAS